MLSVEDLLLILHMNWHSPRILSAGSVSINCPQKRSPVSRLPRQHPTMTHRFGRKKKNRKPIDLLPLRRRRALENPERFQISGPEVIEVVIHESTPLECYAFQMRIFRLWFPLKRDNTYALPDCDARGRVKTTKFHLIQVRKLQSSSGESHVMYACSCEEAKEQNKRLFVMANLIGDNLRDFAEREEALYCIHSRGAKEIIPSPFTEEQEDKPRDTGGIVEHLKADPFFAAVHDGTTYGVLRRYGASGKLCCMTCKRHKMSCKHVMLYTENVD